MAFQCQKIQPVVRGSESTLYAAVLVTNNQMPLKVPESPLLNKSDDCEVLTEPASQISDLPEELTTPRKSQCPTFEELTKRTFTDIG